MVGTYVSRETLEMNHINYTELATHVDDDGCGCVHTLPAPYQPKVQEEATAENFISKIRPLSGVIDEYWKEPADDRLVCPVCGCENSHVIAAYTLLGSDANEARVYQGTSVLGYTSERRSTLAVEVWGECGHLFRLLIGQHKGDTLLSVQAHNGSRVFEDVPRIIGDDLPLDEDIGGGYRDYLASETWQRIRYAALWHAGFKCQQCNETRTLNVHHNNYPERGKERPEDLLVLCRKHHAMVHGKVEQN